jgi:hypothetical protein
VVDDAVATQKGDWVYGPNAQPAFKVLADLWGKAVAKQDSCRAAILPPYCCIMAANSAYEIFSTMSP